MLAVNTTSALTRAGAAEATKDPQSPTVFGPRPLEEGLEMTRMSLISSPLLLGFEDRERLIERVAKAGSDGYPPFNIERIGGSAGDNNGSEPVELLRITLAVAGFKREQIEITVEDNQLKIRGRQEDARARQYIHRGIAALQ